MAGDSAQRGRGNKLVAATGEYLVAAELCRRGLIATTFTGNVPHFDIVVSDAAGRNVSVQVKASRSDSWQIANIKTFCEIIFDGKHQVVGRAKRCPIRRLIMVYVTLDPDGNDKFYILTWQRLRDIVIKHHKAYLKRCNGIRPRNWKSLHSAVNSDYLSRYENAWDTIDANLK